MAISLSDDFSIFLALYDQSEKSYYTFHKGYIVSAILAAMIGLSVYYAQQYIKVANTFSFMANPQVTLEQKTNKVLQLNPTYGFGFFNDLMIYEIVAEGNYPLEDKIAMGHKMVHYFPTYPYLVRHGTLLALNGNQEQAIYYLSASCDFDYGKNCKYTKEHLKAFAEQNPNQFEEIHQVIEMKYH